MKHVFQNPKLLVSLAFILASGATAQDGRPQARETVSPPSGRPVYQKMMDQHFHQSVETMGELIIVKRTLDQYDQEQTNLRGGLRFYGEKSPEQVRELAEKIKHNITGYHKSIAASKAGDRVTPKDVVSAVEKVVGVAKSTRGNVPITGVFAASELYALQTKYENESRGTQSLLFLGEKRAEELRTGTTKFYDVISNGVMEHFIDPNIAKAFDVNYADKVHGSVQADDATNLRNQERYLQEQRAKTSASDTIAGRQATRALDLQLAINKKRQEAAADRRNVTKAEIQELLNDFQKKINENIIEDRKAMLSDLGAANSKPESLSETELRNLRRSTLQHGANTLVDLTNFLGPGGNDLGKVIGGISSTALDFSDALEIARKFADDGKRLESVGAAALGGIGAVVSLALLYKNLLFPSKDISQHTYEQVVELRNEVRALHEEMRAHFSAQHHQISAVYVDLLGNLNRIENNQAVDARAMVSSLRKLKSLGDQLSFTALDQQQLMETLSNRILLVPHIPEVYEPDAPMSEQGFKSALAVLKDCASKHVFDAIANASTLKSTGSPIEKLSFLARHPEQVDRNGVASSMYFASLKEMFPTEAEGISPSGNESQWMYCAAVYLAAMKARPDLYRKYLSDSSPSGPYDLRKIREAGEILQQRSDAISPELIVRALRNYNEAHALLGKAYGNAKYPYLNATLDNSAKFGLPENFSMSGLDPWANTFEQKLQIRAGFRSEGFVINHCKLADGKSPPEFPAVALSSKFTDQLVDKYPYYAQAERLKLGTIEICYRPRWIETEYKPYEAKSERGFGFGMEILPRHTRSVHAKLQIEVEAVFHTGKGDRTIFQKTINSNEKLYHSIEVGIKFDQNKQPIDWQWWRGPDQAQEPKNPLLHFSKTSASNFIEQIFLGRDHQSLGTKTLIVPSVAAAAPFSETPFERTKTVPDEAYRAYSDLAEKMIRDARTTLLDVVKVESRSTSAIHEKLLALSQAGGEGHQDSLQKAAEYVEGTREGLDFLVSNRLPHSLHNSAYLRHFFWGAGSLPEGERALKDFSYFNSYKVSAEDLKSSIAYTQDIRNWENAQKLGFTKEDFESLQKRIDQKVLTPVQRVHLTLFILYKELIATRLDVKGYSESDPRLKELLDSLRFFEENFETLKNSPPIEPVADTGGLIRPERTTLPHQRSAK